MSYLINPYRFSKPIQEFSNSPNATGQQDFDPANDAFKGEKVTTSSSVLLGIKLTDVQFYMYRSSTENADAEVTCGQFETDGTLVHAFWVKSYNSFPQSAELTDEDSTPSSVALTTDHVIGTLLTTTSSTAGTLYHRYDNGDNFDGTDSTYAGNFGGEGTPSFDRAFVMKGY